MQETIKTIFGGPLEMGYYQTDGGVWTTVMTKEKNLVLYAASDILAKCLTGDPKYAISKMYFEFTNGSVPSVTPLADAGISYYSGLDGVNKDYIRSNLDFTPSFASGGPDYVNNIVRFFGVTTGTEGIKGLTFNQSSSSKVYGGALACSPTSDHRDDIVFARFYFPSSLTKLDGSQIGIKWGLTL